MRRHIRKLKGYIKGSPSAINPVPLVEHPGWQQVLQEAPAVSKSAEERVAITVACGDCDNLPKVNGAGGMRTISGKKYQLMHNGILVEAGGYFGDWMASIIKTLRGHHEPQEEKVFHSILERIPEGGTMIELGSYWAYYSMWFNKKIKKARNFCCEPDPVNIALGERNAALNKCRNMKFILSAAGKDDGKQISFKPQEGERDNVEVLIRSVDGIVDEYALENIDILHMDIQGVELDAIEGAVKSIRSGKVRFLIVSTHHFLISGNPLTHEHCLARIKELGGYIIAEHAVHESFSGDGLIAASFSEKDKDFTVEISENRMQNSLFRSYTDDIAILARAYENVRNE